MGTLLGQFRSLLLVTGVYALEETAAHRLQRERHASAAERVTLATRTAEGWADREQLQAWQAALSRSLVVLSLPLAE
jgi:hypothetical protein